MTPKRYPRLSLLVAIAGAIVIVAGSAGPSSAGSSSPSRGSAGAGRSGSIPDGAITAVVVRSWAGCGAMAMWNDLNANWSQYGSIPIHIDYSDPALCGSGPITLAALEANGADVVILSNPAGGNQQLELSEMMALRQYALEGHDVFGTYLVFHWGEVDNTKLALLFGLRGTTQWLEGEVSVNPIYIERNPANPLFRNVGNPYISLGYPFTQTPASGQWSPGALQGAVPVGGTADRKSIITTYRPGPYDAVYIGNFPEYNGGTADEQFYYNAIIFPATG